MSNRTEDSWVVENRRLPADCAGGGIQGTAQVKWSRAVTCSRGIRNL